MHVTPRLPNTKAYMTEVKREIQSHIIVGEVNTLISLRQKNKKERFKEEGSLPPLYTN